jgi:hypothetical protein
MLTEVTPTMWAVKINGQIVIANLGSQRLAENAVLSLPAHQRALAEVVPMTQDGKMVLFG